MNEQEKLIIITDRLDSPNNYFSQRRKKRVVQKSGRRFSSTDDLENKASLNTPVAIYKSERPLAG